MELHRPDYQLQTSADRLRRRYRIFTRWVAAVGIAVVLLVMIFLGSHVYTDWAYEGMAAGMTRAEVDRHLWEFSARVNTTYNSVGLGETMIDYELLGLGKWTRISVIFKADGKSHHPIPMFDN